MIRHRAIHHEMAELAAIGAGGVQAEQRNSFAGFLEIDPMHPATEGQVHIAADDGIDRGGHPQLLPPSRRGAASTSLM